MAGTPLTLTFDKVVTDIRCPTEVNCVVNGPVIVKISAELSDGPSEAFEMNPDEHLAALPGNPPNIVAFEGFEIELTAVDPYPAQPEDIMNLPYTATLIVRKAEAPQEESGSAVLGEPFTLAVGESATIEETGLRLTFEMVERDGRCPSAVLCAENGPVVIIVSAIVGSEQPTTFTMNPNPQLAQLSGIPPNTFDYQGYTIELTAVEPYPEQPEDLMNLPYTATFVIR